VLYKPLSRDDIYQIVDLMMQQLQNRLMDKQITVQLTKAAKEAIVEQGYDATFGARPLKRFIQTHVETLIGKEIIKGNLHEGSTIVCDYVDPYFKVYEA